MICRDIDIASKHIDEIVILGGGSVYAVGTPGDVITSENLREVYGVVAEVVDDGRPHVILKDSSVRLPEHRMLSDA